MFYKICSFLLAVLIIPVVNVRAYKQNENLGDTECKYIYYNVDGDNYMSDQFKYPEVSAIDASWVYYDEEMGSSFCVEKNALSDGGMIRLPLKSNVTDKSNITLFFDFNLAISSDTTHIILPTYNINDDKHFYIKGKELMYNGAPVYEIKSDCWYSLKYVKTLQEIKLYIALENNDYEYVKTVNDGLDIATQLNFGYKNSIGSGTIYYDNFKLCSNNESELSDTYTPRYFSVFYNVGDDDYSVKKLLGENAVFTSGDYFYSNGDRKLYSDYSSVPVYENKKLLVETNLYAQVYGLECVGSIVGGFDMSENIKSINDKSYIDVFSASEKLGFYTYDDERGFVVSGKTQCSISNSYSPFEIKESADSVYRYMYFERPDAQEILTLASFSRPRILTNDEALLKMAQYLKTDTTMQNWKDDVIRKADNLLSEPCVEYKLIGIRLLSAAQTVLERCAYMASAYYLTGESEYANKCIEEMLNACAWDNWNTSKHYLDNSELCYAIAIGFDTFYDFLSKEEKQYIIEKTTEHSLSVSVSAYEGTFKDMGSEWRYASGNWGAVCAGGMTSALISFAGEKWGMPETTASYLLSNAMHSMEYPVMLFYPDGAWSEGTGYWEYTTKYFMGAFLGSLYFSTGSTWGFLKPQGVSEALNGFMYLQSQSSGTFNFADSACFFTKSPIGFIFAKFTGDKGAMAEWNNIFMDSYISGNPYAVLWYEPYEQEASLLPRDKWLISAGAGIMREKWNDPEAIYIGVKGGQNYTNHDNLDLGSFIFDALGERWAMELGKDNYNINGGYWGLSGYELYVKRPEGQNCLVINPEKGDTYGEYYQQKLHSFAHLTEFISKEKGAYMVLDLTDANSRDVKSYQRGFYFGDDRKSLIIQDELELIQDNSTLYWSMHTEADISVSQDGKSATLTIGKNKLKVTLDTNADIKFSKTSATALPGTTVRSGENSRDHINKLLISGKGSGNVYISVKLTPQYDYIELNDCAKYIPISQWEIPDGEIKEHIRLYQSGNTYNADIYSDFSFTAYLPYDCEKCEILADDEVVYEIALLKKGVNYLTLPGNTITKMGNTTISIRAYGHDRIEESLSLPVHFSSSYSNEVFNVIDFEGETVSNDASFISEIYNIDSVVTKDKSVFSVENISGNGVLGFTCGEKINSVYPFIRKRFSPISCGRVAFEFDLMSPHRGSTINFETRSTDNSYASFDLSRSSLPILTKYNKFGNSSFEYPLDTFCHIEIVIDLDMQSYIVRADGMMVSQGTVSIKDLVYMGLNFGNANVTGGKTYIDNIMVTSFCIKDDITDDKYIAGIHSDNETTFTSYIAYYFEGELIYLEKQSRTSSCVRCEFDKKNIKADCVKIIITKDIITPCRESSIYLYQIE